MDPRFGRFTLGDEKGKSGRCEVGCCVVERERRVTVFG